MEVASVDSGSAKVKGDDAWSPPVLRDWRVSDGGTFFQVTDVVHPVTESLGGDTPWNQFPVFRYWQIEPTEKDTVLIRYAGTDHAALLQRRIKGGVKEQDVSHTAKLLFLTTPLPALTPRTPRLEPIVWDGPLACLAVDPPMHGPFDGASGRTVDDDRWHPLRDSAAPRCQHRRSTCLREQHSRNRCLCVAWGSSDAALSSWRITPIPVDPPAVAAEGVTISEVHTPGVYWLKGGQPGIGFSANLPADAIDLDRISQADLDASWGPDSYQYVTDPQEIQLTDSRSSHRISLASPAILLALLVFLLEQVLGNRFYRS